MSDETDSEDAVVRAALVVWLRYHAPSRDEIRRAWPGTEPLLDALSTISGSQIIARLADSIEAMHENGADVRRGVWPGDPFGTIPSGCLCHTNEDGETTMCSVCREVRDAYHRGRADERRDVVAGEGED